MAGVATLGALLLSCGDDCSGIGSASCAPQLVIRATISDASDGGPVQNVSLQVSNGAPTMCSIEANATVCKVWSFSGTFTLIVAAPGFQSIERDITVKGENRPCSCPTVVTENVAVSLSRAP
jgi:hypothetical protein